MNWWLRYTPFAIALAGLGGVLIYGLLDAASNIDQFRHILVLLCYKYCHLLSLPVRETRRLI